jgi:hypothetical protein
VLSKLTALATSATLAACSVVGVRETPEPPHQVVGRVGAVEVRQYGPRIAAETAVPGGEIGARGTGFQRLAGYIFGRNRARQEIAMTTPVAQGRQTTSETIAMTAPVAQGRDDAGQWVIRFFMPAQYTMETLPQPLDPLVRLVAVPGETMAVLRFSGSTAPGAVAAKQGELLRLLDGGAWRADGTAVAWFYDPPWTLPPFRRNEVAVPVVPR